MSRAHFSRPVQDLEGNVIAGGSVMLYDPQSGVPYGGNVFSDIQASTPLTMPWVSDNGIIDFYLDTPQFISVGYTPATPGAVEILFHNVAVSAPGYYIVYLPYTLQGLLSTSEGDLRLYVEDDMVIDTVRASVGTSPTGSPVVVDILRNGVDSVFTDISHAPTIAPGDNTSVVLPDNVVAAAGDFFTMSVLSVGSDTPGTGLTVQVKLHQQSPDGIYPAS